MMPLQPERVRVWTHFGQSPITVDACTGGADFDNWTVDRHGDWFVPCECCNGLGEHEVGVGADIAVYTCATCLALDRNAGGWWLTNRQGRKW